MFTCDRCQKSYNSERRYGSHVERCALSDLNDDTRSVRSSRSTGSRKSNAISDVESDYRKDSRLDVDKLLREKTTLKTDLKKYARELQRVKESSRNEVEKTQDYFNQQIYDLTEERDRLNEEIAAARDNLFTEKDHLRDDFNRKLTNYKEQLEKRYSSTCSKHVKRLNQMVDKLQQKLDDQLEEKDKVKDELEKYYTNREETLRNEFESFQEETQKTRMVFEKERDELKRISQTCNIEKDAYKMKCDTERDQQIQKVMIDKKTSVQTLEGLNQSLRKRVESLESERTKESDTLKTLHQNTVTMKEHQMNEMKSQFKRRLEESTKSLESQLQLANNQVEKAVLETTRKHKDKLKQEESQHEKIVEALRIDHERELRDMNTELATYRSDVEYHKKHIDDCVHRKEQDMIRQFQHITEKLEAEKESLRQKLERDYAEAITSREQKLSKLQDEYNTIEEELLKHRLYTKRVKHDAEQIKSQCVSSLNRQKNDTDKIITEREQRIQECKENYETRIEHMKKDFIDKMNNVTSESEKDFNTENLKLKNEVKNLNNSIIRLKSEFLVAMNAQKEKLYQNN